MMLTWPTACTPHILFFFLRPHPSYPAALATRRPTTPPTGATGVDVYHFLAILRLLLLTPTTRYHGADPAYRVHPHILFFFLRPHPFLPCCTRHTTPNNTPHRCHQCGRLSLSGHPPIMYLITYTNYTASWIPGQPRALASFISSPLPTCCTRHTTLNNTPHRYHQCGQLSFSGHPPIT